MLVVARRYNRRYVVGSGFIDTAVKFLTTHKDTISNIADVAKAGAKTAEATKQIYDVIKARKGSSRINKVLSDKSVDILNRLSEK